jgi:helicase MOV-10
MFNRRTVAISRTEALLIVIGNPAVLSLDPSWCSFMNFVFRGGGWKGKKPDWDTAAPVKEMAFSKDVDDTAVNEIDSLASHLARVVSDKCQKSSRGKDGRNGDISGILQTWLDIE